jgi:signal transduction histidine kinase
MPPQNEKLGRKESFHGRSRVAKDGKGAVGSLEERVAALAQSEQLVGMVLDQLPVVLFATDRNGVILLARGKGAVRLGPGAVGRSAFELFADAPSVAQNLRRALAGEAITTEGENDHVWWETRYMPLRGADGAVEGVVGVTMDATARKRAEEDLKKANVRLTELDALKARFVANVSHELRTPLALVLGVTERMRRSEGADATRAPNARDLATIEHNARLLLKQVNDLLDVAKLDAGTAQPAYAEVDLASLVALAGAQFESIAAERGVTFTVATPDALPAAVDPNMVQQVLFNLLSNAFKLTPPGGTVRCALEREGDQAAMTVADSGPGVPPSRREVIFERFVQLDRGDEQRFGGTGLGLSIVRDYVQLHGGRIAVEDAAEGGARFVVRLPLAAPAGAEVRPQVDARPLHDGAMNGLAPLRASVDVEETSPAADGRPLVLVVEDNPEMRRFMADALGRELSVVTAEDGERGLATARARRPAAIVTDLMMPRMGGEKLLGAVRADRALADTPVLVLTARADDEVRLRLLREGAHDYLLKPFAAEELLARVRNAVALKRARDLLAQELQSTSRDVGELAAQVVEQQRNLRYALDSTRAAREDAERAVAAKSDFLGAFAEQVRPPLASLKRDAETLSARGDLPREAGATVGAIASASSHLVEAVDALLGYADVHGGRLSTRPEDVDVAQLARGVVDDFAGRAGKKGITVELAADAGLAPVRTDARLLRVLLANLVGDAVEACPAGAVAVAVSHGPRGHVIRVGGAGGAGGSGSSPRPPDGLALGRVIVRHVADALGASLDLDGGDGPEGTRVTVTLPRPS